MSRVRISGVSGHEIDASFDEAYDAGDIIVGEFIGVDVMLFEHGLEQFGKAVVRGLLEIFVVEPPAFVEGEFRSGARAVVKGEFLNQLVHRHDFSVVAGIPSEKCEEVYYGFGEIT